MINKSGGQVLGVGYCLSVIFYAFYLTMLCPKLKVTKCSKFEQQQQQNWGLHFNSLLTRVGLEVLKSLGDVYTLKHQNMPQETHS